MRSRTAISALVCALLYSVGLCRSDQSDHPLPDRTNDTFLWPGDDAYCAYRHDGPYPAKELCASWFMNCKNGQPHKEECARGLFFNPETSQCDYKENVISCRNPFNCTRRKDGAYANGCTAIFWYCSGGTVALSQCQHGTYFDVDLLRCDYKEYVPACGGVRTSEAPRITEGAAKYPSATNLANIRHDANGGVLCTKDGAVGIVCSRTFWICANGVPVKQVCPHGLVFDVSTARCAYPENMQACAHLVKQREESTHSSKEGMVHATVPTVSPEFVNTFPTYTAALPTPTVPMIPISKESHPAMDKSVDPSSRHGRRSRIQGRREWRAHFVYGRASSYGQAKLSDAGIAYSFMEHYAEQPACKGRSDGRHFISKCSNKCLLCLRGKGVIVKCAHGHVFSRGLKRCVPVNEEPECMEAYKRVATFSEEHYEPKVANFVPTAQVPEGHARTSCAMLPDGPHELLKCYRKFVYCANGATSLSSCGSDLVFNGRTGQCDHPENTPSCDQKVGVKAKDASRPHMTSVSTDGEKCAGKPDGFYTDKCSEKYYACSNGLSSDFVCPIGLVFNTDTAHCDYREFVQVCGGKSRDVAPRTPSIPPFTHMRTTWTTRTPYISSTRAPIAAAGTESRPASGCSVLKNGLYSLEPCSPGYFHCWKGATSFAKCTHGLVFNPDAGRCDFRRNNRHCAQGGTRTASAVPSSGGQVSVCSNRADGLYAEGCAARYFACYSGIASYMSCSAGLVFDANSGLCDFREKVAACRGTADLSGARHATERVVAPIVTARPASGCAVLPNGPHPLGRCLADYVVCYEGTTRLTSCSPGLFFNSKSSFCDFRKRIPECDQVLPKTAEDVSPRKRDPAPGDSRCAGRRDGVYSGKCSATYILCSNGVAYSFSCPRGLVYNTQKASCDYSANVPACFGGGSITSGRVAAFTTMPSHMPAREALRPTAAVVVGGCSNKPDGNYPDRPCASTFYTCSNGVTTAMSCPETLVFNAETGSCDFIGNVATCGSKDRNTTPLPPTAVYVTPAQTSEQMAPGSQSCNSSADGVYAIGPCSNEFIYCWNGHPVVQKCPKGLAFSPGRKVCDHNSECGVHKEAVIVKRKTEEPTTVTPSAASRGPSEHALLSCEGRRDGAYALAHCSNKFFYCFSQSLSLEFCPRGMVFSEEAGRCDNPTEGCVSSGTFEDQRMSTTQQKVPPEQPAVLGGKVNCASLADGDYAEACSNEYFSCYNGIAQQRHCPSGLVFDTTSKQCTWREQCGQDRVHVAKFPHQLKATKPPTPAAQEAVECSGTSNRTYGRTCDEWFTACSNGRMVPLKCPTGLVFVAKTSRCEYPPSECTDGQAREQLQPTSALTAPPVASEAMECSGMSNRTYGRTCDKWFTACSSGRMVPLKCPPGLVFVAKTSRCEYPPSECTNGQAQGQLQPTSASTALPVASEGQIDCRVLPNGDYSWGCVADYVTCANGAEYKRRCPEATVFDNTQHICVWMSAYTVDIAVTASIQNGLVFDTIASECVWPERCAVNMQLTIPTAQQQRIQRSTVTPSRSVLQGEMDCSRLSDGAYGSSCSPAFTLCSNGIGYLKQCPTGLLFNGATKRCEYPNGLCFGENTPPTTSSAQTTTSTSAQQEPAVVHEERPSERLPSPVDCSALPDGIYGRACENTFVLCTNGLSITRKCPQGLIYNPKSRRCEFPSRACAGQPSGTSAYTADIAVTASSRDGDLIACSKLTDGDYSLGCTPNYVSCVDGFEVKRRCQDGLVFDTTAKQCVWPEQCTSGLDAKPFGPSVHVARPVADAVHSESIDCSSLLDGLYGKECSASYVICSNGFSVVHKCPYGLVYSPSVPSVSRCAYPSARCSASSTPFVVKPSRLIRYLQPGHAVDCRLLPDGDFSMGCSPEFLSCHNGIEKKRRCAGGLVFDNSVHHCVEPTECIERERYSSVTHTSIPPKSTSWTQTSVGGTPTARTQTSVSGAIDCSTLPDGIYGSACATTFVQCANNQAHMMQCPTGLVFDVTSSRCDFLIGQCVPGKRMPPVPAASPTVAPVQREPYANAIDCASLPDGIYGSSCAVSFVHCSNGKKHVMHCPAGLVFDLLASRCKFPNHECSTDKAAFITRPASPSSAAETASSGAVNCSSLPDGVYGSACANSFVRCSSGHAHKAYCPAGLVFDVDASRCKFPSTECHVASASAYVPSLVVPTVAPTVPTAQVPFHQGSVDCSSSPNGVYGTPCANSFTYCANGRRQTAFCPAGLVFNSKTSQCDFPSSDCGIASAPTYLPTLTVPVVEPTLPTASRPFSQESIDCTLLRDGVYGDHCSATFTQCSAGHAFVMFCPMGLVFDRVLSRCDFPKGQCRNSLISMAPSVKPLIEATETPAHQHIIPDSALDCGKLPTGDYSLGCFEEYITCLYGSKLRRQCPHGLVFYETKHRCVWPGECSSVLPQVATNQFIAPTRVRIKGQVVVPANAPANAASSAQGPIDCSKLSDGLYGEACSILFVQCSNGQASVFSCPASLVFSPQARRCDYPTGICSEPSSSGTPSSPSRLPAASQSDAASQAGPVDCSKLSDGLYGEACSTLFVQCSNGQASVLSCPTSLVFIPQARRCDYPTGICSLPSSGATLAIPSRLPAASQSDVASQAGGRLDCTRLSNGDYSAGCTSTYTTCIDGTEHARHCPASLVYDSSMRQCVLPEQCSGTTEQSPFSMLPANESPLPAGPIDCSVVKKGVFGVACSTSYVECTSGRAFILHCSAGLVFSPQNRRCEYPMRECVSSKVALTPGGPMSHPSIGDFDCSKLENGEYSSGCTAAYVTCANGVAHERQCPNGLVFDSSVKYCVWPEQCGKAGVQQSVDVFLPQPSYAAASPLPMGPIECRARPDGVYGIACSPSFIRCSNGQPSVLQCPNGLVFNPKTKRCEYSTGACHLMSNVAAQHSTEASQQSSLNDCSSLPDGIYGESCSTFFTECSGGKVFTLYCPAGLLFSMKTRRCEYPSHECASIHRVSTTLSPPQADTTSTELTASIVDCGRQPDGEYSNSCTQNYVTCSNGAGYVRQCPAGLLFHPLKKRCVYAENCLISGDDMSFDATPAKSSVSEVSWDQIDCSSSPNGVFGADCSTSFVECSNGHAYVLHCPQSLVFSSKTRRCEHSAGLCKAITITLSDQPQAQAGTVDTPGERPQMQGLSNVITSFQPSGDVECSKLPDGVYGHACSASFTQCSNGVASTMYCPAGLMFSSASRRCEYPSAECGFEAPPTSTPLTSPRTNTPIAFPVDTGVVECSKLPDGFYGHACWRSFTQCSSGVASTVNCPGGLMFSPASRRCEYPSSECGFEAPPASAPIASPMTDTPMAAPVDTGEIDCATLSNGVYGVSCSASFVECWDGRAFMMRCSLGLVFSVKSRRCERAPIECRDASALHAKSSMVQHPAEAPIVLAEGSTIDCSNLPDGDYSSGCTEDFTTCTSGTVVRRRCASGLLFDKSLKLCVWPEQCGKAGQASDVTPTPQMANSFSFVPPITTPHPSVSGTVDCSITIDGVYGEACSSWFLICMRGRSVIRQCPQGLLFSPNASRCQFPPSSCNHQPAAPMLSVLPTHAPAQEAQEPSLDCSRRRDGDYSLGCVREFITCTNGMLRQRICPESLVFDGTKGRCVLPNECGHLASAPRDMPTAGPALVHVVEPAFSYPARPTAPVVDSDLSGLDCSSRRDGDYSLGCVSEFITCVNGMLRQRICAESLVFDGTKGRCVFPSECGQLASAPPSLAAARPAFVPPIEPAFSYPERPTAPVVESDFSGLDCSSRRDGDYSLGCVREFITCVNGMLRQRICAESLVFDGTKGRCVFPSECGQLASAPPSLAAARPAFVPPIEPAFSYPERPTAPVVESDFSGLDCSSRRDGDYSLGCVREFITCTSGMLRQRICPESLVFDGSKGRCVLPGECGQLAIARPSMPVDLLAFVHTAPVVDSDTSVSVIDCSRLRDGRYSMGCFADFVICFSGRERKQFCPHGLVFDNFLKRCVWPGECHSAGVTPVSPAFQVAPQYASSQETAFCTMTSAPRSPSSVDCSKLHDGAYSLGCSSQYVVCSKGLSYAHNCPAGLVFVISTGLCDWPSKCDSHFIPEKGCPQGTTPVVYPSPPVASGTPQQPTAGPGAVDCSHLPDGVYGGYCSAAFTQCSNGLSIVHNCPQGLVFDQNAKRCDWPYNCHAIAQRPAPDVISTPIATSKEVCTTGSRHIVGVCSTTYLECVHGLWRQKHCPAMTTFDVTISQCSYAAAGCPRNHTSPLQYPTVQEAPQTESVPPAAAPFVTPQVALAPACLIGELVPRGNCLATFLECVEVNKFVLRHCAEGYLFDVERKVCRLPIQLPQCVSEESVPSPSFAPTTAPSFAPPHFEHVQMKYHIDDTYAVNSMGRPGPSVFVGGPTRAVDDVFSHVPMLHFSPYPPRPLGVPISGVRDAFGVRSKPVFAMPFANPHIPAPPARNPYIHGRGPVPPMLDTYRVPLKPVFFNPFGVPTRAVPVNDVFASPPFPSLSGHGHSHWVGGSPPSNFRKNSGKEETLIGRTSGAKTKSVPVVEKKLKLKEREPGTREELRVNSTSTFPPLEREKEDIEASGHGSEQDDVMKTVNLTEKADRSKRSLGPFRFGHNRPRPPEFYDLHELTSLERPEGAWAFLCHGVSFGVKVALGSCRSDFIICEQAGEARRAICPPGELFDERVGKCLWPSACGTSQGQSPQGFPCDVLPEGNYAMPGCFPHFIACVSRKAIIRSCSAGLFYNAYTKQCDHRENVPECSMTSSHEIPHLPNDVPFASSPSQIPTALPKLDCVEDGAVSLGCSSSFVQCSNGKAYAFTCQSGLVFDRVSGSCNYPSATAECGGSVSAAEAVALSPSLSPTKSSLIDHINFDCTSRPDGLYSNGCSQVYMWCSDGVMRLAMPCPSSTFFSQILQRCDFREAVPECGGISRETPSYEEFTPQPTSPVVPIGVDMQEIDCSTLPDGPHVTGCSGVFFVCSSGRSSKFVCQVPLKFNKETNACDYEEFTRDCGGAYEHIRTTAQTSAAQTFVTTQPVFAPSVGMSECSSRADGVISKGCSAEFTICSNGIAHTMTCQQGLVYSDFTLGCDFKENVIACGGSLPSAPSREYTLFGSDQQQSQTEAVARPAESPDMRCIYANASVVALGFCRIDFLTCLRGFGHDTFCIRGHLFDHVLLRCVPAAECGHPNLPASAMHISPSLSRSSSLCDGLADGSHKALGSCRPQYITCRNGSPERHRCSRSSYVFSSLAGVCIPRAENPECQQHTDVAQTAAPMTDVMAGHVSSFCSMRDDGLYRHPDDCAKIIQCFGKEQFEYQSCSQGLVFNEVSGGCDYRANVPGCADPASSDVSSAADSEGGCRGRSHGDFVADERDCATYYRCIWGRLERKHCPGGTVFNPTLNVCDYPSEVPSCSSRSNS
ncbi:Chondroitin proteoglycan 2 [Toxocara canis]|uniref:Chondroitin proteoglycan 2 n=1 Tax=Toxocara canis TaxID=6265 RepID=A0A0B2UYQ8_TOXCA|nr:Chondroitin proteoglycan 2 [Toxocara canis]